MKIIEWFTRWKTNLSYKSLLFFPLAKWMKEKKRKRKKGRILYFTILSICRYILRHPVYSQLVKVTTDPDALKRWRSTTKSLPPSETSSSLVLLPFNSISLRIRFEGKNVFVGIAPLLWDADTRATVDVQAWKATGAHETNGDKLIKQDQAMYVRYIILKI